MADLNALIAQGVQFKAPPDPFAQYAQMQQLQQGEQSNQLNQMKMQEYQRGVQEQNALRGVVSRPGFDPMNPTHAAEAYAAAPTLAPKYLEQVLTTAESRGKITAADIKAKSDRQGMLAQAGRDLANRPDDENIISHNRDVQDSSLFTPNEKAKVQARTDMLLGLPMDQRAATIGNPGASAGEVSTAATALAGQKQTAATALAGQIAAAENARLGRVTTERGQNIVSETAAKRLAQENQGVTYQTDANGNIVAMQSRLAPGETPTARSVVAPGGGMQPLKAKPTALAEKTKLQQQQLTQNLGVVIGELKDAVKEGGLIDQSTGSGAGRLTDVTAGFFGKATPGAIAIGKLQPIADLALKMVPRFEGPQSDKDTASYKQAAGQLGDATLPTAIRKEAAKTVIRLMENRKSQFMSSDMAAEGVAPSPTGSIHDQADAILRGK